MKRLLAMALALLFCAGLSGCISIQSAGDDPTGSPIEASAPASESSDAADQLSTSETDEPSIVQQDGRFPGLSAHYPWDRVLLPEEASSSLFRTWRIPINTLNTPIFVCP